MATLGIIQAGHAAAHPHRHAARKLGGKSLLERVVRQVTDCEQLDHVIVLCGDSSRDAALAELVPPDVPVFSSKGASAASRLADAVDEFQPDAVVRVCADTPFIDPVLIDRLVIAAAENPSCDYISYCLRDGRPAILSKVGFFAEWYRVGALRMACRACKKNRRLSQAGDPTRHIVAHPEQFNVRLLAAPESLDRDDVRLTVDSEEDWENAQVIFEALGPERLDWRAIAQLLEDQPEIRGRMATLNRADPT